MQTVLEGVRALLDLESRLEADMELPSLQTEAAFAGPLAANALAATTSAEPEYRVDLSVITGLGAEEYPGFPADVCPEELPDPSRLHNLLADALKRDAALYEAHRTGRTKSGVSFAKCIKRAWTIPAIP